MKVVRQTHRLQRPLFPVRPGMHTRPADTIRCINSSSQIYIYLLIPYNKPLNLSIACVSASISASNFSNLSTFIARTSGLTVVS